MKAKIIAISGGSRGIGRETAKLFACRGWTVFNLSRRPSKEPGVIDICTDVTDETAVKSAFTQIQAIAGHLNLLVNNAGYGISGAVEFTELEDAKRQFNVNLFGTLNCIKAALPMLKESRGRIICTSSAAAVFAIPFQSFYSASKASINILVNSLANELKPFGVSVCALQLGDVKTDFTAARVKNHVGDDVYGGAISRSVAVMERDEGNGMPAQAIARAIYRTAQRQRVKPIYTVGAKYKVLVLLNKLLPNRFVNYLVGKLYIN